MVYRLIGTKPLSEQVLTYHLDPKEHTSMKFESKYKTFQLNLTDRRSF